MTSGFKKVGLGLCCLGLFVACGPKQEGSGKLKVGTVDIMRVMEERPETQKIRMEWSSQAGSTYLEISDVASEEEAEALKKEIAKRSEAWEKKMDTFMEESISLVEEEAKSIAKERGLDIVVVDNPLTQTIRYRDGEDISTDISLNLQKRN